MVTDTHESVTGTEMHGEGWSAYSTDLLSELERLKKKQDNHRRKTGESRQVQFEYMRMKRHAQPVPTEAPQSSDPVATERRQPMSLYEKEFTLIAIAFGWVPEFVTSLISDLESFVTVKLEELSSSAALKKGTISQQELVDRLTKWDERFMHAKAIGTLSLMLLGIGAGGAALQRAGAAEILAALVSGVKNPIHYVTPAPSPTIEPTATLQFTQTPTPIPTQAPTFYPLDLPTFDPNKALNPPAVAANAQGAEVPKNTTYTVQDGDTLSLIAEKYRTTVQKIVEFNKISNPNEIYPGQKIFIP